MLNYWDTYNDSVGIWEIQLFPAQQSAPVDYLCDFVAQFLEVAEREMGYRWLATNQGLVAVSVVTFSHDRGMSYSDYLRGFAARYGYVPLFGSYQQKAVVPMWYYDTDGSLVERDIENLEEVLRAVRPNRGEWEPFMYEACLYPGCPVYLWGEHYSVDRPAKDEFNLGTSIYVETKTDIWLPVVVGEMIKNQRENYVRKDLPEWYDNGELARLNASRLNRMLSSLRALTLAWGGSWELVRDSCMTRYRPLLTETDVILSADLLNNSE